jgi:hypothetical protein
MAAHLFCRWRDPGNRLHRGEVAGNEDFRVAGDRQAGLGASSGVIA